MRVSKWKAKINKQTKILCQIHVKFTRLLLIDSKISYRLRKFRDETIHELSILKEKPQFRVYNAIEQ